MDLNETVSTVAEGEFHGWMDGCRNEASEITIAPSLPPFLGGRLPMDGAPFVPTRICFEYKVGAGGALYRREGTKQKLVVV